jgi:D-alanyl-D-alanine carboxypeptidase
MEQNKTNNTPFKIGFQVKKGPNWRVIMNKMKIIISSLLVLLVLSGMDPKGANTDEIEAPPITGEFGVAIDAVTGKILYSKNPHTKAYPASMTKVLTAIILDEKMEEGELLTVSSNAAKQPCICLGITAGERISTLDAMKALLLVSANDVAVTIAENVAGSEKDFARLMNQKIKDLGLKNTHFVTPNGLHNPNHYTTPYEMALITKEALRHPKVLNVLSMQSTKIKTNMKEKSISNLMNIHGIPNAVAGKPGFTNAAQHTLVEYLKKGDKGVIAVVMKSTKRSKYKDIQTMANYSFAQMN